jgi:hypothetical protein
MGLVIDGLTETTVQVVVAKEKVSFTVAAESFSDWMQSLKWAAGLDLLSQEPDDRVGGLVMGQYSLMARITAWEGIVNGDGSPLPCTPDNKLRLFGKYPQALVDLSKALNEAEARARKNSKTSPAG